ncbi:MAG: hypothetical protein M0P61_16915 [Ignavibacteriaceae bacterium]|jgi:hypothetical protein|nr:hypothetical protein [Ignavibacteriaceae bacterium]
MSSLASHRKKNSKQGFAFWPCIFSKNISPNTTPTKVQFLNQIKIVQCPNHHHKTFIDKDKIVIDSANEQREFRL